MAGTPDNIPNLIDCHNRVENKENEYSSNVYACACVSVKHYHRSNNNVVLLTNAIRTLLLRYVQLRCNEMGIQESHHREQSMSVPATFVTIPKDLIRK